MYNTKLQTLHILITYIVLCTFCSDFIYLTECYCFQTTLYHFEVHVSNWLSARLTCCLSLMTYSVAYMYHSFVVSSWNYLPDSVKLYSSISCFKTSLLYHFRYMYHISYQLDSLVAFMTIKQCCSPAHNVSITAGTVCSVPSLTSCMTATPIMCMYADQLCSTWENIEKILLHLLKTMLALKTMVSRQSSL